MIVRSNELNILQKLLERGAQISVRDRRAIARNGAIFTGTKPPKQWTEVINRVPQTLITALIIPKRNDEESCKKLWRIAAQTYLEEKGLYYDDSNDANYTKTVDAQDILDIQFSTYPETFDPENRYTERETLQDLTGHTTVIHLGNERNNRIFIEIANVVCSQFLSNPLSKCLLWIYDGGLLDYLENYGEIEVGAIIDLNPRR